VLVMSPEFSGKSRVDRHLSITTSASGFSTALKRFVDLGIAQHRVDEPFAHVAGLNRLVCDLAQTDDGVLVTVGYLPRAATMSIPGN
jgi:hypothetical protein